MSRRALAIYLQDHLAGSTAGVALARRVAKRTEGTPAGQILAQVAEEIAADRTTLQELMEQLGISPSPIKNATAWLMERLARLKPNGRLRGQRALQELHELETLSLGIAGKQALWEALRAEPEAISPVSVDLDTLDARARSQRERVEMERIAFAHAAFAPEGAASREPETAESAKGGATAHDAR
jgi:hypothetical protein